jgi:lysophospholipase L1-like esterase
LEVWALIFAKGDKIVMIGDSITDCGRARPIGEGLFEAIGKGYVALVDAFISTVYPQLKLRVINMGCSGNTVRDLAARWQTDVIDLQPDWVTIMIGINDVWRQYDTPLETETHVYIQEYESLLRDLVVRTKPLVKGIILITPYYIEGNREDRMRASMDEYGNVVRRLAVECGVHFVDTQAAFDRVLVHSYPASIAWDRVHPTMVGHAVIAREILNTAGFSWTDKLDSPTK